jgi:hypothetical protein
MKNIILTIICYILIGNIKAQTPYLQWAKSLGGVSTNEAVFSNSIATDESGNVYTVGTIKNGSADLNPDAGIFSLTFKVAGGIFISKLDAAGNFVWAKQVGDGAVTSSSPIAISVDKTGNVCVTGGFAGTGDFDPGVNVVNLVSAGEEDIFILKLDNDGNFVWAKRIGSAHSDISSSIVTDALGNAYITGRYNQEVDFDPGSGVYNLPSNGCPTCVHSGAFVLKLNTDGNFVWAKQLGAGIGESEGNAITIDEAGNVYTTGDFSWLSADFDPGSGTFNLGDLTTNHKTFISKLDNAGNFIWARGLYAIGDFNSPPAPQCIKVDVSGNVITAGYFTARTDFDPGIDSFNLSPIRLRDAYISKLDPSGNFVWAKSIGSTSDDEVNSFALDASGNVYILGEYYGTVDFDPGPGTYFLTSTTYKIDVFMSKLNASGDFAWAANIAPTTDPYGNGHQAITIDAAENIYAVGLYNGTVDFDPGNSIVELIPAGGVDIFVSKYSQSLTGIDELSKTNDLTIYPNPSSDQINIEFSKEQKNSIVRITDLSGKEIKIINFSGKHLELQRGEFPKGIYILQISNDAKTIEYRKIVLQ